MKKTISLFLIIILGICIIINRPITLSKTCDRNSTYNIPEELKYRIDKETAYFSDYDANEPLCTDLCKVTLDYSLSLTAELLEFAEQNNISRGKANCVGYAQVCAAYLQLYM